MINFLKYRLVYFFISSLVIISGLFSIIKWGYYYSVDFIGGTNLEFQINKKVNFQELKKIADITKIQILDYKISENKIFLKTKPINEDTQKEFERNLEERLKIKVNILLSETVGPTLGEETVIKTIIASFLAILGILIYMSFAFHSFKYSLAAILAMIHDFFVVIGIYSILSHFYRAEFDTMFITALLTTMSFSIHDTIVIFDKIREYQKEEGQGEIEYYANRALTETMVRSLNNSMTIIFMLLALILLGGSTIRFFIITLLIGTLTGTYSSPFVATPILVLLEKRKK